MNGVVEVCVCTHAALLWRKRWGGMFRPVGGAVSWSHSLEAQWAIRFTLTEYLHTQRSR
jgi:hypothetical protein